MPEFEWDEAKDRRNRVKHGISFKQATAVFSDPHALEILDIRFDYREERFLTIGMSAKGILAVVNAQRGERYRIISARPAERNEADDYYQNRG